VGGSRTPRRPAAADAARRGARPAATGSRADRPTLGGAGRLGRPRPLPRAARRRARRRPRDPRRSRSPPGAGRPLRSLGVAFRWCRGPARAGPDIPRAHRGDAVLLRCPGARPGAPRGRPAADSSSIERLLVDVDVRMAGVEPEPESWCTAAMADAPRARRRGGPGFALGTGVTGRAAADGAGEAPTSRRSPRTAGPTRSASGPAPLSRATYQPGGPTTRRPITASRVATVRVPRAVRRRGRAGARRVPTEGDVQRVTTRRWAARPRRRAPAPAAPRPASRPCGGAGPPGCSTACSATSAAFTSQVGPGPDG
jgi:hypothetical protein